MWSLENFRQIFANAHKFYTDNSHKLYELIYDNDSEWIFHEIANIARVFDANVSLLCDIKEKKCEKRAEINQLKNVVRGAEGISETDKRKIIEKLGNLTNLSLSEIITTTLEHAQASKMIEINIPISDIVSKIMKIRNPEAHGKSCSLRGYTDEDYALLEGIRQLILAVAHMLFFQRLGVERHSISDFLFYNCRPKENTVYTLINCNE